MFRLICSRLQNKQLEEYPDFKSSNVEYSDPIQNESNKTDTRTI